MCRFSHDWTLTNAVPSLNSWWVWFIVAIATRYDQFFWKSRLDETDPSSLFSFRFLYVNVHNEKRRILRVYRDGLSLFLTLRRTNKRRGGTEKFFDSWTSLPSPMANWPHPMTSSSSNAKSKKKRAIRPSADSGNKKCQNDPTKPHTYRTSHKTQQVCGRAAVNVDHVENYPRDYG